MTSIALAAMLWASAPAGACAQAKALRAQAERLAAIAVAYVANWSIDMRPDQARVACEYALRLAAQGLQLETQAWQIFVQTRDFGDFFCAVAVTDYAQTVRWIAAALHLASIRMLDMGAQALAVARNIFEAAGAASTIAEAVP